MKGDWFMKQRTLSIAGIISALVIIIPIARWLASPLWINRSVDDAFSFELPAQEVLAAMSAEELNPMRNQFNQNYQIGVDID
jgi:hypothetical protein